MVDDQGNAFVLRGGAVRRRGTHLSNGGNSALRHTELLAIADKPSQSEIAIS
jgi:hypothetical protein